MSAKVIDGRAIAAAIRGEIKQRADVLKRKGIDPCLAVVLVGDDPGSAVYVRNKARACQETGIVSRVYHLTAETRQEELLNLVRTLNDDPAVHGVLVQSPLPAGLDEMDIVENISPQKDVDAFHIMNAGKIFVGQKGFCPCTPQGVITLIESTGEPIAGKHAVVLGRSNIVGKPMAILLLEKNATVTICHSKTHDLPAFTRQADILVSAIGKPGFVTAQMIKPGAIVIDVGTSRTAEKKVVGDVRFHEVAEIAGYITPVPGGVGPMTITKLLENTLWAAERIHA